MSYPLLVKDIKQLVQRLGEDKVTFMGHSMGGRVGMILALTQPQLIEKLICVDSTPVNTPSSIDWWDTLVRACSELKVVEEALKEKSGIYRAMYADEILQPIIPNARDRSLFVANLLYSRDANRDVDKRQEGDETTSDSSDDELDEDDETERVWRLNINAFLHSSEMPAS